MSFFKKILASPNFIPILVVLVFGLLAGRELFLPGYFNMHDDLQMMRQLEMEKCFLDGQIPCRWIPDMGYGFGFPLFNFYPPLPYLIGQGIRLFGFSFVSTIKTLFILSFLASGITLYFLAKEFFGRLGGVISSIFYVWAPYHSVDVYVRGAMNEAWALVWFPLIFLTSYKLIKEGKTKHIIFLSLSWVLLLTSHNLMAMIFGPIFALWCLIFLIREKAWRKIPQLVISGILALLLAAFFTLPAVLEQGLVQVNTLITGYYEYIAHFVDLNQLLISRFWGYGPSVWGENDGMPFQIGHVHWVFSLVLLALFGYRYAKTRKMDIVTLLVFFFVAVGWLAAFMTHSRSTPIWQAIPTLKFVQFPWRFLTIVILAFSFIAGSMVFVIPKRFLKLVVFILTLLLLVLNWNYFKPEKMGPLTDEQKFSGAAWELQQTAGIYDYLPKAAIQAPQEPQRHLAEILAGRGTIENPKQGTNWATFKINVISESANVRLGIFKFPDWRTFIDGKEVEATVPASEKWGRMYIEIPEGQHSISLKLYNTPIRSLANAISLMSWFGLLTFPIWKRRLAD